MKRLNVKHRVVLGLVGLTVSLVMLAFMLGVVPDRASAVREGRAALAEAIALHSTVAVMSTHVQHLEADYKLLADRNADLLSLALRRQDGQILVATGDHADHWQEMGGIPGDEEPAWGQWVPDHGKFNVLVTDTIVHHYSFFVQQDWLDRSSLLEDIRMANLPDTLPSKTARYYFPRLLRIAQQVPRGLKRKLSLMNPRAKA
jgi:hypothetical protein